jgi:tetratricopeptide (TPR) repeat protein
MSALLDKSLLRRHEDAAGEPRFTMLETIREYALERLAERGEGEALRRRHAVYYTSLADVADAQLGGAEQILWLGRLDAEIDNMRAALAWLQTSDTLSDTGLQLAGALASYWLWRGMYSEGRTWLSRMLAQATQRILARGRALREAGLIAWFQGDFAAAAQLLEESLALCQELDDELGLAWALRSLAVAVADQDDVERAYALFAESLALFRRHGHVRGTAWALAGWGSVATRQADFERARTLLAEGLTLFRELRDRQGMALALCFLGYVTIQDNNFDLAAAQLRESLALSRELRYQSNTAWALLSLGTIARKRDDTAQARTLIAECLEIFRELDERRGIEIAESVLGRISYGPEG